MHSEREFMHAKHGSRPKYAFGERIHARRTCLMPPFLRAERGGRMIRRIAKWIQWVGLTYPIYLVKKFPFQSAI